MSTSNNISNEAVLEGNGSFVAHSAAELSYKFYYDSYKRSLELFAKDLEAVLSHVHNCIDCLSFLESQGESFAKIYLLLEYMGHEGISEDFVTNLEELATRARDCLDNDETLKLNPDEEFDLIRRLNSKIDEHERDFRAEQMKKASMQKAVNQ